MPEPLFNIALVFEHLPDPSFSARNRAQREACRLAANALRENSTWVIPTLARVHYEFYSARLPALHQDLTGYLVPACQPWLTGLQYAGLLSSTSGWYLWIGSAVLIKAKHNQTRLIIEHRL